MYQALKQYLLEEFSAEIQFWKSIVWPYLKGLGIFIVVIMTLVVIKTELF